MLWRCNNIWKRIYAIRRSNPGNDRAARSVRELRHGAVMEEVYTTYTHAWLCQHIVENTQEAITFADREGMIRLWNTGAEAIFGYTAAEVLGQSLELIIPERLQRQ